MLQDRFEDMTRAQRAEGEILALKQRGRLVADYVQEFRWIAGKLWLWLERLLVHHFKAGLDCTLRQACAYRDLPPPQLKEWYQAATELDAELRECRPKEEVGPRPRRVPERQPIISQMGPTLASAPPETLAQLPIQCF